MNIDLDANALHRTIAQLQSVPADVPVAVLLRHSIRDDIPDGATGIDVPLNALGIHWCRELGKTLPGKLRSVWSSPVLRCVQTAEIVVQSSAETCFVSIDHLLGAPGVYVRDEQVSWENWLRLGNTGVIGHLIAGAGALPGMADPSEAAERLVKHMLARTTGQPGLHIFVSHDSIVAPTVARAIGQHIPQNQWPGFLDAASFWCDESCVMVAYRERMCASLVELPRR